MATPHPRIQVTVDPELADALAGVDPSPRSRSRLVRDLALHGARVVQEQRRASAGAADLLLAIADGDERFDVGAPLALHAGRVDRLP